MPPPTTIAVRTAGAPRGGSSGPCPRELRRSLARTDIIENAPGTVHQVSRDLKRWRNAEMALRWTATGLLEAQTSFHRLKAYRQFSILRKALANRLRNAKANSAIETIMQAA